MRTIPVLGALAASVRLPVDLPLFDALIAVGEWCADANTSCGCELDLVDLHPWPPEVLMAELRQRFEELLP